MPESELQFVKHLKSLEHDFGLPDRFLLDLSDESDWSFTIKLHSLIEAALTQAVMAELDDARLKDLVEDQTMLGRFGKMALAEALGIVSKTEGDFIKRLTKIRNHVVHKLAALSFALPTYVASLDHNERKNALRELLFLGGGPDGKAGDVFATKPRLALWVNGVAVVTKLVARKARAELNSTIHSHYRSVAEGILGPLKEVE